MYNKGKGIFNQRARIMSRREERVYKKKKNKRKIKQWGNLRAWGAEAYIKKALKITYQTKLENIAKYKCLLENLKELREKRVRFIIQQENSLNASWQILITK